MRNSQSPLSVTTSVLPWARAMAWWLEDNAVGRWAKITVAFCCPKSLMHSSATRKVSSTKEGETP